MTDLDPAADPHVADTSKAEVSDPPPKASYPAKTRAKDGSFERPISTRSGNASPVFDADPTRLEEQSNGNVAAHVAKPAPTPTHRTAIGMLLTSWAEMKMKFADFDHNLDLSIPAEAELQDVIDFLRART